MKIMFYLLFSISLLCFSCEKPNIEGQLFNADSIIGEWRYVRTSTKTSSFFCLENCPNFDYSKSKYILNFDKDGKLTGRINLLIIDGKYSLKKISSNGSDGMTADEVTIHFNILNKPPETQEDSEIKALLENSQSIKFQKLENKTPYNYLTIYSKGNEFMLFVRKL